MEQWNVGKMEYWGAKGEGMRVLFYFLISAIQIKRTDLIPPTQYSNIPVFHHPTANVYDTANLL
jgi:hypothetical protein